MMNEYSIVYSTQQSGMMFETIVVAKSKKDALNKLYKQLGTDFYYDDVILERKNVGGSK